MPDQSHELSPEAELNLWLWLAGFAVCILLLVVFRVAPIWLRWCVINVEGAGRKVYVGIHGFTGNGVVRPNPMEMITRERERTTYFVGPLVRPFAFVNPDRDELRMDVPFVLEGAPASSNKDQPKVLLRVSWSIPNWVPCYDIVGRPGDHGRIPRNLRVHRDDVPDEIMDYFDGRRVEDVLPHPLTHLLPGAAVIAYMNKYTEGEHLERLFEFITQHTREFMGSFHFRELMRVRDENETVDLTHDHMTARIRGQDVTFQSNDATEAHYVPNQYASAGEFTRVRGAFLTRVAQLELEPYGIFVNDVSIVQETLPTALVDANRAREARRDQVDGMRQLTDGLTENVTALTADDVGMSPDVAGLVVADSIGTESRPGVLGALLAIIGQWRN